MHHFVDPLGGSLIPLLDSYTREFQGKWSYVGIAGDDGPDKFVPFASLSCLWERTYARVIWGNALRLLMYECTEENACGLPARKRIKFDFKMEHWFKSQTHETENSATGPLAVAGATDEIYELQCRLRGPPSQ